MDEGTGKPIVSIVVITYNHEGFISQAIEGALMQETDFPYEIIIGEDESQDATREKCIDYAERYPDKIRLFLRSRKDVIYVYGRPTGHFNATESLKAARGKYIAACEGDDYWTDPRKLQKQVDFLDSHPDFALCFHPVWTVFEDCDREPLVFPQKRKPVYGLKDLMEANFIPTCSTMFRAGLFGDFPDWYHEIPIGDWSLHVLNAQHGYIGCIDEVMAVYRKHNSGAISRRTPIETLQTYFDFFRHMNAYLDHRFERTIRRSMARQWERTADDIARIGFEQGSLEMAQVGLAQVFAQWPPGLPLSDSWKSKVLGRMYALFAFAGNEANDPGSVRYCLPRAIGHDLTLLGNLGIWSIGFEAFLGRRVASRLRRMANRSRSVKRRLIDASF